MELQTQYAVWLEALPDNLQDGATADALRAVCDLDLPSFKQSTHREDLAGTDQSRQYGFASHQPGKPIPLRHPAEMPASPRGDLLALVADAFSLRHVDAFCLRR